MTFKKALLFGGALFLIYKFSKKAEPKIKKTGPVKKLIEKVKDSIGDSPKEVATHIYI